MKNLKMDYGTCSYVPWATSFDLSRFKNLKTLVVESLSFIHVNRVKISGLNQLESVIIGYGSLDYLYSIRLESEKEKIMI